MRRRRYIAYSFLVTAAITLLAGCHMMEKRDQNGHLSMHIHYLEIVCHDVAAQVAALERVHGLSFGPAVADLGQARVAEAPDGSLIGVRAPLAQHEQPIIRTYLAVEDIARAVEEAEAAGAVIAYPPTQQGDTGTWAIYILGDVQIGLWQRH
jgi:predicted enzyme related to lactoylglutathione lyase